MKHASRQKVVVGIIFNQSLDSVLVAKRPPHKIKGDCWEFPGGKARPGEAEFETLSREINEETGIVVRRARKIHVVDYDYPDTSISMSAWIVDDWNGKISGKEGQLIKWSKIENLSDLEFPEANKKLIKILKLPLLYVITPDLATYDNGFFKTLAGYIEHGLKLIQFRCPSLESNVRNMVAEKILRMCEEYGCKVILNASYDEARSIGAHGVHLTSKKLMDFNQQDSFDDFYVAGSCHNIQELEQAQSCNLDFCVLSPVCNTSSHSHSIPLGWDNIIKLSNLVQIPVYALGGVKHHDVNRALMSGCYGISMISGVWESDNGNNIIKRFGSQPSVQLDNC